MGTKDGTDLLRPILEHAGELRLMGRAARDEHTDLTES